MKRALKNRDQNGMTDERILILHCQKGDKQAYGFLVKKHMKRAYFVALGLTGSHDDAMDLSQDAFVRAYRAIEKLDANRKFFTWYYRILRNLCLNRIRDRTRHARPFSEVGENVIEVASDAQDDPATQLEKKETAEALWKAMNALKPQEREIIVLKDFQEMSYREIGECLGCPLGTVISRLYHARRALKSKLEKYLHEE